MTPCAAINMMSMFSEESIRSVWGGKVYWDYPMAELTTLKVGGPAKAVIFPTNENELSSLFLGLGRIGINWRVIGHGSNILASDKGFDGVVIVLGKDFSKIEKLGTIGDQVSVRVYTGCSLKKLLNWCIANELGGLEFTVGIPGSVGGAVVMNAGAHGSEIKDVLLGILVMDAKGKNRKIVRESMRFSYRDWGEGTDNVVVTADFALHKSNTKDIEAECKRLQQARKSSQPLTLASAGSFFKNPEGQSAGYLIEKAGLKGFKIGGAMVSDKHANFIVNAGGATAKDILELKMVVQKRVLDLFGVLLEPEVKIWVE